ncbi:efflux RND transporter periplasmic adaptor subunit [Lutibacter flavus]|uniref:RND family efflux transporter, MFP subunit n=1 Tax=Lutibacter flavus TaxID=691689 RepID=A0A238YSD2_9FLAO|nr:efflux RND transporter periplasmic adaptor subunit [Lutibacter flavus]SNR73513.1 RND family efflux transporter, MFP subunit [Lutibacter flavus]
MKKIILLFITATITISCGEEVKTSSLSDLNTEKLELVNKIDSLNKVLKTVEDQISKLDTNKKLQTVTAKPVKTATFKHFIEIQGVVQADKNIEIKPELGGTVKAIYVKEGQRVSAGQTIIQLDDVAIRNSIQELNTQLNLAKTTFERQERLWNQKIGSEMQYLQAKAQMESLENNLASLKTQARKMKVIAPFSGIIDEIYPKNGELTSPQMPVVRLLNLDKVYVEADVTETYLPVIKIGTKTIVNFLSINKEVTSEISQIGNFINPDNRSFKTRININNKDNSIKPNLLADIKIQDFEEDGIIIPSNLVQKDQNGNDYVFVIHTENGENKVVKNIVTIKNEYNHNVLISEGLIDNDTLIYEGARLVKANDIVEINNK